MTGLRRANRKSDGSVLRRQLITFAKLAAPAVFTPLTMAAHHSGSLTRDYRLYAVSGLVLLALYLVAQTLGKLYTHGPVGVSVSVVIGIALLHGNQIAKVMPGGVFGVISIVTLFAVLTNYTDKPSLVVALVGWLVLAMWLWIGAAFIEALMDREPSRLANWEPRVFEIDERLRDVLILIVDEYPNAEFLRQLERGEGDDLGAWLAGSGFDVDESIWTSYSFTEYALPSFFMLELPLTAGDRLSEATRSDLVSILGGNNPVMRSFQKAGFRTWLVESGWSGLRCMPTVDECVERSWYDEGMGVLVGRSLFSGMIDDQIGRPFSHGVERSMAWMRNNVNAVVNNDSKDLVVIHLMLPHQPLAFSAECERSGSQMKTERLALRNQVQCANRVVREFVSHAGEDPIILIIGDHGTQLLGQPETPVAEWDEDMVAERMRTIAAIRGIEECSEPPPATTVNVFIRLMRCIGAEVSYVEDVALATSVQREPLVNFYLKR